MIPCNFLQILYQFFRFVYFQMYTQTNFHKNSRDCWNPSQKCVITAQCSTLKWSNFSQANPNPIEPKQAEYYQAQSQVEPIKVKTITTSSLSEHCELWCGSWSKSATLCYIWIRGKVRERKRKGGKGSHFSCLIRWEKRKMGWFGVIKFSWGLPFCYHSQIGWKERERKMNFGIIIIFIIKLPIYPSILILNHIFKGT